ncbi:hypothetical protein PM082_021896 [Marasmius tenuissimus]|nr:hypothetical protein PM082_021896 [Marasmius tenuissimus]
MYRGIDSREMWWGRCGCEVKSSLTRLTALLSTHTQLSNDLSFGHSGGVIHILIRARDDAESNQSVLHTKQVS